jgi:O-acetyl-ADP-ribose deacetylase (regulator of RNase III)
VLVRTSKYEIGSSLYRVLYGDITKVEADVLVSSDDNFLSMGGGVSMAIHCAGGPQVSQDAQKLIPLELGDVAVTTAGKLPAKYVFHAVTIDYTKMHYATKASIEKAVARCLELADALRLTSIAFPALGAGVAGFPYEAAAEVMTRTIGDYLRQKTRLQVVSLVLFEGIGLSTTAANLFYERAAALASVASQSKRLDELLGELQKAVGATNRKDLIGQFDALKAELGRASTALAQPYSSIAQIEQTQDNSAIAAVSQQVVSLTERTREEIKQPSATVTAWEFRQLEQQIARTKLEGILTQLNVIHSQLNRQNVQRAKYAGLLVPPILENTISDLEEEIQRLEAEASVARQQLASFQAM